MSDKAKLITWRVITEGMPLGDSKEPFVGIAARGEIDGREFYCLIPMTEAMLDDSDLPLEEIVRDIVENSTLDTIGP